MSRIADHATLGHGTVKYDPMLGKSRGPWGGKSGPMLDKGGCPSMRGVRGVVCGVWWRRVLCVVCVLCVMCPRLRLQERSHTSKQGLRNNLAGRHQGFSPCRGGRGPNLLSNWALFS